MKILVVDDHELFRAGLIQTVLATLAGASVCQCGTLAEAITQQAEGYAPHLVVTDLELPDASGIDAVAHLKLTFTMSKIIALSMHSDRDVILRCIAAGASGYLYKGLANSEVVTALTRVMEGGIFIPNLETLPNSRNASTSEVLARLTERQREVVRHLVAGASNKVIAYRLGVSVGTVKVHLSQIYSIMGYRSRTGAVSDLSRLLGERPIWPTG